VTTRSRLQHRRPRRPQLTIEPLADRLTPTVGFGWAFGTGTQDVMGDAIAADAAGNTYVTGRFAYTVDFDPAHANPAAVLTSHPSDDPLMTPQDAFLAKYDPADNCVWAVDLGGGGNDEARSVAVDAGGNAAVTG
jgi:hypothetical protein